ncbi:hypothetical protein WOLCODRAFT_156113 [Wolfiporia cocos MD-104 SS10]|uniref:Helicase C-terminal domain-containing protein n=1 Tax=Wolfiporia cocos (strain MD-104) TaxID=742152 RepID=A0A2H3IZN0_WOLCO|nr:hypothetical protein WOLCODRAFT_156113 [Wolfiporia cocos MD-104 SS10]
MGVEGFGEEKLEDLKTIEQGLSSVLHWDWQRLKQSEQSNKVLDRIAHGRSVHAKSAYFSVMAEKMEMLRDQFAGSIIWQMVNSLDFKGDLISGLPMYHEHIIQQLLLEWDQPFFDIIMHNVMVDDYLRMVSQIFTGKIPGPGAMNPSSKIDSLITLLKNHLAHDNTQPMRFNKDSQQLVIDKDHVPDEHVAGLCSDKIIVYCAFPSNIPMITPFLQKHNIEYLWIISQGMSIKQRSVNLKYFRKSRVDGPCMLLLSDVGMVGLNIADVNILIVMDTLWSAQEDGQLIRRLWQHPQPKWVHIYRPIAAGTPNVFLKHHLTSDNTLPMAYINKEKKLFPIQMHMAEHGPNAAPNKIDHAKMLKAFQDMTCEDAQVLIMSDVGMVGLKIAFVNMLIIMDMLWSVQEDTQLIGRVWHHPQIKLVEVYRLIAAVTPDVFLGLFTFHIWSFCTSENHPSCQNSSCSFVHMHFASRVIRVLIIRLWYSCIKT